MSAWADDLRYFYGASIGRTDTFAVTDAASAKVAEKLEPGRYLIHFLSLSAAGVVWVKQGPFAEVAVAAAGEPHFPLSADGIRAIEIVVRPGPVVDGVPEASGGDGIAARCSAGASCTLVVTKINRDKG